MGVIKHTAHLSIENIIRSLMGQKQGGSVHIDLLTYIVPAYTDADQKIKKIISIIGFLRALFSLVCHHCLIQAGLIVCISSPE